MSDKLKPCPFCGGEASLAEGFYSDDSRGDRPWIVSCKSCFALVRQFPDWENWNPYCDANVDECEAEMLRVVIETWNTRAERTCRIEGTYSDEYAIYDHLTCGHVNLRHWHEPTIYCSTCGAKVVE